MADGYMNNFKTVSKFLLISEFKFRNGHNTETSASNMRCYFGI